MKQYVITITRQFGSLGRPIARRMSEILGVEYFDRDIVDEAARKMNLPVSVVSDTEDRAKSRFSFMRFPLGNQQAEIQDQVFHVQEQIIRDLASKQSCIIVGRCADYVLRNFDNRLDFYIYASYEARYRNCIDSLYMQPEEVETMIRAVDKAREAYHKKYAGYLPQDPEHKALMIDSSVWGVEETAKLLAQMAMKKFEFS